jgi:hypothetical protein
VAQKQHDVPNLIARTDWRTGYIVFVLVERTRNCKIYPKINILSCESQMLHTWEDVQNYLLEKCCEALDYLTVLSWNNKESSTPLEDVRNYLRGEL